MASRDNFEIVNDVLQKVNLFYASFTLLYSYLDANNGILGTTFVELAFETGHSEFKQKMQQ